MLISPTSRRKRQAWEFINWFATKGQESIGVSGDFPANLDYNQVPETNDVPAEVYKTLASEKPAAIATLAIRDEVLAMVYNDSISALCSGETKPQAAATELITKARAYAAREKK
jgi:ABC-type glycerol-3-phosphate transport system substrate-binding protein